MSDRVSLGRVAMRRALELRRTQNVPRESPVNVYDVATALGIEVNFLDCPSLEGMFYRGPHPVIFLPSWAHRPKGRIAFSCAHEIGHCQSGHGTHVDEYLEVSGSEYLKSDDEFVADTFASSLTMPRQAVMTRFLVRGWQVETATPLQLFIVAGELDVGYTTLLNHLRYGLDLVGNAWMNCRTKVPPKRLRTEITGDPNIPRVTIVDDHWPEVPIDLEVGDAVAVPVQLEASCGTRLENELQTADFTILVATKPGKTTLSVGSKRYRVRVARSGFCGKLKYRFLSDPDEA